MKVFYCCLLIITVPAASGFKGTIVFIFGNVSPYPYLWIASTIAPRNCLPVYNHTDHAWLPIQRLPARPEPEYF